MFLLQKYDFEIIHKVRRQHGIANYLSRIITGEVAQGVLDSLRDASPFMVQVNSNKDVPEVSMYADWRKPLFNCLQRGQIPANKPINVRQ